MQVLLEASEYIQTSRTYYPPAVYAVT